MRRGFDSDDDNDDKYDDDGNDDNDNNGNAQEELLTGMVAWRGEINSSQLMGWVVEWSWDQLLDDPYYRPSDYDDDDDDKNETQVSVEGEPHEKAVELLKAALSSVKLVVRSTLYVDHPYNTDDGHWYHDGDNNDWTTQVHTKSSGGDGTEIWQTEEG